jgi:group I intron endonuclease
MNKINNANHLSCIYEIRNLVNNKIYIGSTNNLMYRQNYHLSHLRSNTHYNPLLQGAWNKYGEDNFQIDVLMIVDDQRWLFVAEQAFLDEWKPEYNISKNAQVPTKRGDTLSKEHIEKIRSANVGYKHSQGAKDKMSIAKAKVHKGLISPDGDIYKDIFNMAKFCREHELQKPNILALQKGLVRQHKGWTLLKDGV